MSKPSDSREIALEILVEILERGAKSHVILRQALTKYGYLDKSERAFITRLTEGTVEYLPQLDFVLDQCSKTAVGKMKPVIRTILRMSVYQILYMDRVPDPAVCNEAVNLAVRKKFQGLKGFVNGVLRTAVRRKKEWSFGDDALGLCLPQWLCDMWLREYGKERTASMGRAFLKERRLTVRCNFSRASRQEILESLGAQGVTAEGCDLLPSVLFLKDYDRLENLSAFQNGWIQAQDMSSVMAGLAAGAKPGDSVLDVCGAPGGKSLHMADLLNGTGHVQVRDLSDYKVDLIRENILRSGFENMDAFVWDATVKDPSAEASADILLADLPCSGLGVIGRKPEIKYRVDLGQIAELAALQRQILSTVWSYVKPGGELVYSTCTVTRAENEDNVRWFLENFPFDPVSLEGRLPAALMADTAKKGWIQLLPGELAGDGFFIAVMRRRDGNED